MNTITDKSNYLSLPQVCNALGGRLSRQVLLAFGVFVVLSFAAIASGLAQQADAQQADAQQADAQTQAATTAQAKPRTKKLNKPEVTENIGVDSKTGDMIPLDLSFRDTEQRLVELGTYFDGTKPVILSFNYSDCPKLCSVQLENMTKTLKEISGTFKVNEDFQMISISIDPNEQVVRARQSRQKYIDQYDQEGTDDGFHFLTGKRLDIQKITDACGFRYRYITRQKYYSHPPVFILISPDGKIVRYIHGLKYDPKTIELALIESAEGKIGSPINILSYGIGCFVFDESTGKYTFQAMALMRAGGIATIAILLLTLGPYWFMRSGSTDKPKQGLPSPDATT